MRLLTGKLKRAKRRRNLRVHFVTVRVPARVPSRARSRKPVCGFRYCAVYPPSTVMSWPVMNAAPGELSQSTVLAISSGVPMRPIGVCVAIVFFMSVSPSPKARSNISVWMGPGETLLTRMPCLANRRDLDKI